MQVFAEMRAAQIDGDVITCCSLISALESGGQWLFALQLFVQMCIGQKRDGSYGSLYKVGLEMQRVRLLLLLCLCRYTCKDACLQLQLGL